MSIVVITIQGEAQKDFVNILQQETDDVRLTVLQIPPRLTLFARFCRFIKRARFSFFTEVWYALLLRSNSCLRDALSYFRATGAAPSEDYLSPVLSTYSVNSEEVYEKLKEISPDLLVVWGSTLLDRRILSTAKRSINLHFGQSPYYRGALANQHAVQRDDLSHIGATVHYINGIADGGDILALVPPDLSLPPKELFMKLNKEARAKFLDIAKRLNAGEGLTGQKQANMKSNVLFLREWTPKVRYEVGKKVLAWEKRILSRTTRS